MRKTQYQLVDKKGNVIVSGTYDECMLANPYEIVRVGEVTPVYRATFNNSNSVTGTIDELCEKLQINKINMYNYTRYKRKKDGLFLERIN